MKLLNDCVSLVKQQYHKILSRDVQSAVSSSSSLSQENDRRAGRGQVMKMPPSISISSPTSPSLPSAGVGNNVTHSDDESPSIRNIYVVSYRVVTCWSKFKRLKFNSCTLLSKLSLLIVQLIVYLKVFFPQCKKIFKSGTIWQNLA